MISIKPNKEIWARVNQVILGENAAEVLITFQSALCQMLMAAGVVDDEEHARVHLAAVLLSPDTHPDPGALMPMLQAEFARLKSRGSFS